MLRRALFLMVCLAAGCCGARAEGWTARTVDGAARVFNNGEWRVIEVGDELRPNSLVESPERVRLTRGLEYLDVREGKARIEQEGDALVRVLEGALGVHTEPGRRIQVLTSFASIETRDATFSVTSMSRGAALAVHEGSVLAIDFNTRNVTAVREGQGLWLFRGFSAADIQPLDKERPGETPLSLRTPPENDNHRITRRQAMSRAIAAIGNSDGAARQDAPKSAERPSSPAATLTVAQVVFPQAPRSDGKPAADTPKPSSRPAPPGRPMTANFFRTLKPTEGSSPAPTPAPRKPGRGGAPLVGEFDWVEMGDDGLQLKSLCQVILSLSGVAAYVFWTVFLFVGFAVGGVVSGAQKGAGLGLFGNTATVLLAFATALGIRDLFFRAVIFLGVEPFLSLGMMLTAMVAFLFAGAYAKYRMS